MAFGESAGSALTRFLYTSREKDAITSLAYYRARWYDSYQGRFLSEDPIGGQLVKDPNELGDSLNLYVYVLNNPINNVDPYGLCAMSADDPYLPNPDRKPPGWDPAWPTGKDARGPYSQDPKTGRKYYPHSEDGRHWDHYDYEDDKERKQRYPEDSIKPRPGQKKPKPGQSADDPWPAPPSKRDVIPCHGPGTPGWHPRPAWDWPWWTLPQLPVPPKTLPGTNLPDICRRRSG